MSGKEIDLNYSDHGWEIADVEIDQEQDTTLVTLDAKNQIDEEEDQLMITFTKKDYAFFVSRLIPDPELSEKVRKTLLE